MAEQVDARDLKSRGLLARAGSIPATSTIETLAFQGIAGVSLCPFSLAHDYVQNT